MPNTTQTQLPTLNQQDMDNIAAMANNVRLMDAQKAERLAATIAALSPEELKQWRKEGLLNDLPSEVMPITKRGRGRPKAQAAALPAAGAPVAGQGVVTPGPGPFVAQAPANGVQVVQLDLEVCGAVHKGGFGGAEGEVVATPRAIPQTVYTSFCTRSTGALHIRVEGRYSVARGVRGRPPVERRETVHACVLTENSAQQCAKAVRLHLDHSWGVQVEGELCYALVSIEAGLYTWALTPSLVHILV